MSEREPCPATHRVLGRCSGTDGHPNTPEWCLPSTSHGSPLGWWNVGEAYTHWNFWAGTVDPGSLMGGDDNPDGTPKVERYADEHGCVGQTVFR